jgi:hypothetical protein
MKQTLFVLGGALVGGIVGYLAFGWILSQGFVALALPGGLLGVGAGLGKPRTLWPAILCGLFATALGLFTDWSFFPFKADHSLAFYLLHIHQVDTITLVMIALGGAIGFWVPFRRREMGPPRGAGKGLPEKTAEGSGL